MHITLKIPLIAFIAAAICAGAMHLRRSAQTQNKLHDAFENMGQESKEISPAEAAILAYLSPLGDELRAKGLDVVVDTTIDDNGPSPPGYLIVDVAEDMQSPIEVHEYLKIDLRTADVTDLDMRHVKLSKAALGVQRIIRECHGITADGPK